MAKKPPLNEYYVRAIDVAKKRCGRAPNEDTGKVYGAAVWLARELKISRQLLAKYSRSGFPLGLISKVIGIIGPDSDDSKIINIDIPFHIWRYVPKDIAQHATINTQLRRK